MATETAEQCMEAEAEVMGTGGVPMNAKTSDYYRTSDVPKRFDNPAWFEAYGTTKQHPMYRTSAADYGGKRPTVHTMPITFHGRTQKFSSKLGKCGMYRNHSLNTNTDKSIV